MLGDFDKHGDAVVPGQALSPAAPDCGEHVGTCVRCHTEIRSKPKRQQLKAEGRPRATISIKVPKDALENGSQVWDELQEACREKLLEQGFKIEGKPTKTAYYILTM